MTKAAPEAGRGGEPGGDRPVGEAPAGGAEAPAGGAEAPAGPDRGPVAAATGSPPAPAGKGKEPVGPDIGAEGEQPGGEAPAGGVGGQQEEARGGDGPGARRPGAAKARGRRGRQEAPKEGRQARLDIMKTRRGRPTGEAARQRAILAVLASQPRPAGRTRTAMSKAIAGDGAPWKNMYSGVFNDIGGSLVPQGLVEEEGRLPYGRGPKAVQKAGIPYYRLTRLGRLACLALDEVPDKAALLDGLAADSGGGAEGRMLRAAAVIARFAPEFVSLLFAEQAESYSEGSAESLLPAAAGGGGGAEGGRRGGGLAAAAARLAVGLDDLPKRERGEVTELLRGLAQGR